MEQYNIRIYRKAQDDLGEIVKYLNQFYPETAIKYYDLIIAEISTLSMNPKRCALVREETCFLQDLFVGSYIFILQ